MKRRIPKLLLGVVLGFTVSAATHSYAEVKVSAGHLVVSEGHLVATGTVDVASGATVSVPEGANLHANLLQIRSDGLVTACGSLLTAVFNEGELISNCNTGSTLTISGEVTNWGAFRILGDTVLDMGSNTFTNHGLLDLMTSQGPAPSGLVDLGTTYTAAAPPSVQIGMNGTSHRIEVFAPSGRSYQLEVSETLEPNSWIPVGAPQNGADAKLIVEMTPGGQESRLFYRFQVF